MSRRSPRPHNVKTKHPRYSTPVYVRGSGLPFMDTRVKLPLDDPRGAADALDQLDEIWDEADPYERQVILETLRDCAVKSERLLASDLVTDPAKQVRVYQAHQQYAQAYEQWGARRDVG